MSLVLHESHIIFKKNKIRKKLLQLNSLNYTE